MKKFLRCGCLPSIVWIIIIIAGCSDNSSLTGEGGGRPVPNPAFQVSPTVFEEPAASSINPGVFADSLAQALVTSFPQGVLDAISAGLLKTDTIPQKTSSIHGAAQNYYEMGLEAVFRGSISTALYCFLKAVSLDPLNVDFLSKAGFALNYKERYSEARIFLLKAKSLNPAHIETRAGLAKTYEGLGDLERALFEINAALAMHPYHPFLLIHRAKLYIKSGLLTLASLSLTQAEALNPNLLELDSLFNISGRPDTSAIGTFDPNTIDPSLLLPDPSQPVSDNIVMILDTVSRAIQDAMVKHAEDLGNILGIGGEQWNIEQDFLYALELAAAASSQCQSKCATLDDGCRAGCLLKQCAAGRAALSTAISLENGIPGKGAAVYRSILGDFSGPSWAVYYRHPNAVDRAYARQMIESQTAVIEDNIRQLFPESQNNILLWGQDVSGICSDAADAAALAAIEALENIRLLGENPDAGICIVIICISLVSRKVSIGGNAFFVNINLEVDFDKKDVTFGLGPSIGGIASGRLELSASGTVKVTETMQTPVFGPYVSQSQPVVQLW